MPGRSAQKYHRKPRSRGRAERKKNLEKNFSRVFDASGDMSVKAAPDNDLTNDTFSSRHSIRSGIFHGLSSRLLLLTILFVMIAEVLIFVPSLINFRHNWLKSHLETAEAASIVYLDNTDVMLSKNAQSALLRATTSLSVSLRDGSINRLMASAPMSGMIDEEFHIDESSTFSELGATFSTLFSGGERTYRVSGELKSREGVIQLVQEDRYLRNAMLIYGRNVLLISLVISFITAGLVYLVLYFSIVRPIIHLSRNMDRFSHDPENAALIFKASDRKDEIGLAGKQLSALQHDLQEQLKHKKRLADLGLAVSKINHDLRNILATAQLLSDRLPQSSDAEVKGFAPKLIRTLDRAIDYTSSVLFYGKAVENTPHLTRHSLATIIDEVGDTLENERQQKIIWKNDVPGDLMLACDKGQFFRVIFNIGHNAIQAILSAEDQAAGRARQKEREEIRFRAETKHDQAGQSWLALWIIDTGPGIVEMQQEHLFKPFQATSKKQGSGLGLAIAAEIVRSHGGTISLEKSDSNGTAFLIELPI